LLVQRPNYQRGRAVFAEFLRKKLWPHLAARQHEAHISLTIPYSRSAQEAPEQVIRQLADEPAQDLGARRQPDRGAGRTARPTRWSARSTPRPAQVKKAIRGQPASKLAYQSIASLEGESRSHFDGWCACWTSRARTARGRVPAGGSEINLMRTSPLGGCASLGVIAKRAASKEASVRFVKLSVDTLKTTTASSPGSSLVAGATLKSDEIVFPKSRK